MSYSFHFSNICVDAGCFVVGDRDWFLSKNANPLLMRNDEGMYVVRCEPGRYNVHYVLPHSWDGRKSDTKRINISSGELWIVDACYVIEEDDWIKFIDDNYLDEDDTGHFTVHTGGDGKFDLELFIG
jgi:hypothetical protein